MSFAGGAGKGESLSNEVYAPIMKAPRVDFYVLSEGARDARLRYACRLAEQAVERGERVYLHTANASDTQRLDELLWTYSDDSFLPHQIFSTEPLSHERVKVMLGEQPAPASHRQLLINLTEAIPAEIDGYDRIAEIVDADPGRKRTARERFKHYRERGCALESNNI